MCYRLTVTDPRDPDEWDTLDIEYEARRDRDDPSVGYCGYTEFFIDFPPDLSAAQIDEIARQVRDRHVHTEE